MKFWLSADWAWGNNPDLLIVHGYAWVSKGEQNFGKKGTFVWKIAEQVWSLKTQTVSSNAWFFNILTHYQAGSRWILKLLSAQTSSQNKGTKSGKTDGATNTLKQMRSCSLPEWAAAGRLILGLVVWVARRGLGSGVGVKELPSECYRPQTAPPTPIPPPAGQTPEMTQRPLSVRGQVGRSRRVA